MGKIKKGKGRLSGATKDAIDTLAFQNAQTWSKSNAGLLEREIDPEKYIVGPGDVFSISIIASDIYQFDTEISPEGKLMISGAGSVNLKDKSMNESRLLIIDKIQKFYKTDKIDVLLKKLREFKVTVSGTIPKPMTVSATAADRVSEVIEKAGGSQFESSERKIILIRRDKNEQISVDLLKFFMLGKLESNPTVMGGDLIIVPPISLRENIEIQGEVYSPGVFEFVEGDKLSDIVKFSQGFLGSAMLDSVELARFSEVGNDLKITYINLSSWKNKLAAGETLQGDIKLLAGDRVFIRRIVDWKDTHYAILEGEVKYPGKYAIIENHTKILDLISKAGGFTENASFEQAQFIRQKDMIDIDPQLERLSRLSPTEMSKSELRYFRARINEKRGAMAINFDEMMKNPESDNNITLINQDSIIVPSIKDYINIQGRVNNPGNIKFKKGLKFDDYIALAGGYAFRADIKETFITKPKGGQFLAKDENFTLEPGDVILVPTESDVTFMDTFTTALTIVSQLVTILGILLAISNLKQ
jgi:protein involved in polysaccharide export with SLBB domain